MPMFHGFKGREGNGGRKRHYVECDCGSGKVRTPQYDEQNNFIFFTCARCHVPRMQEWKAKQEKDK